MKKLIQFWVMKGPSSVRLPNNKITEIPLYLIDFSRKSRSFSEVCRWKGTKFRTFLLYFGPIVLKNILSDDCYKHFIIKCRFYNIVKSQS